MALDNILEHVNPKRLLRIGTLSLVCFGSYTAAKYALSNSSLDEESSSLPAKNEYAMDAAPQDAGVSGAALEPDASTPQMYKSTDTDNTNRRFPQTIECIGYHIEAKKEIGGEFHFREAFEDRGTALVIYQNNRNKKEYCVGMLTDSHSLKFFALPLVNKTDGESSGFYLIDPAYDRPYAPRSRSWYFIYDPESKFEAGYKLIIMDAEYLRNTYIPAGHFVREK
ncbi:hypothetical protein HY488_00465 [Candidatus Woesearchaeota archaeon]|nr:hypothetical protein [Candidatus Woesearchaeota archaeon]